MFEDNFSTQAHLYARHRPVYPPELYAYLASLAPGRELAWDCGAGSGQAAVGLAEHFGRVFATDINERQLAHAVQHPRVIYRVAPAEACPLPDASCDLVAVAQALHWFNLERFYAEASRVLKPGGVLAVWGYKETSISPEIDALLQHYYHEVVGPYWSPRVRLVEQRYRTIPFPFAELSPPVYTMRASWSLDDLLGYLRSWSATQKYREERQEDPLPELASAIRRAWGDPQTLQKVQWHLAIRVGRLIYPNTS